MNAVDKMLDRRDEYEARWDELYNTTSEFMEGFDVDLDQMLDSGGDSGGVCRCGDCRDAGGQAGGGGCCSIYDHRGGIFRDCWIVAGGGVGR